MNKTRRTLIAGLAVAASLAGAAPAYAKPGDPAAPAAVGTRENPAIISAATGCGASCDGQNPMTFYVYVGGYPETCAGDAKTVRSNSQGIRLELRYSPLCRTAWTRVGSESFYPTVRSYYLDGRVRTAYSGFAGPYYTKMVNDAGLLARAEAVNGPTTWWTGKY
jgi:uncharacterized protein DUF2690